MNKSNHTSLHKNEAIKREILKMKALFNDEIIDSTIELAINDRALNFGDGISETILVKEGEPYFLNYHIDRIRMAANVLGFKLPATLENLNLRQSIEQLLKINNKNEGSVKLIIWRKQSSDRGYGYSENEVNYSFILRPLVTTSDIIERAGFANNIQFSYSILSSIKTLNSLPYILAAKERKERNLDELIVLNDRGFICECVASNIFWIKNGTYYTPPISSGCLAGVRRRSIIEKMEQRGNSVVEKLALPAELMSAEVLFTTNSTGVRLIRKIENTEFDVSVENKF